MSTQPKPDTSTMLSQNLRFDLARIGASAILIDGNRFLNIRMPIHLVQIDGILDEATDGLSEILKNAVYQSLRAALQQAYLMDMLSKARIL